MQRANHPHVAYVLHNLAQLVKARNQIEAESLMRRALRINEVSFGPDSPDVANEMENLALSLFKSPGFGEADRFLRRIYGILQETSVTDQPKTSLPTESEILHILQSRRAEAERLMRRALSIYEVSYGAYHPKVAAPANNLALVLRETNKFDEAELLTLRALKIDEANLGPSHPTVANRLGSLAVLHEVRGKSSDALPLYAKAKPILIASRNSAELTETGGLKAYARALFRARTDDPASLAEGFELAQWALQNAAANGLSAMGARISKGDGALAKVVREHEFYCTLEMKLTVAMIWLRGKLMRKPLNVPVLR